VIHPFLFFSPLLKYSTGGPLSASTVGISWKERDVFYRMVKKSASLAPHAIEKLRTNNAVNARINTLRINSSLSLHYITSIPHGSKGMDYFLSYCIVLYNKSC